MSGREKLEEQLQVLQSEYAFHGLNHFPGLRISLKTAINQRKDRADTRDSPKRDSSPDRTYQVSWRTSLASTQPLPPRPRLDILYRRSLTRSSDSGSNLLEHSLNYKLKNLIKSQVPFPENVSNFRKASRSIGKVSPSTKTIRAKSAAVTSKMEMNEWNEEDVQGLESLDIIDNLNAFPPLTNRSVASSGNRSPTMKRNPSSFRNIQQKLIQVASTYDFSAGNEPYRRFHQTAAKSSLSIDDFHYILRTVFNLWVSKAEAKALFQYLLSDEGRKVRSVASFPKMAVSCASSANQSHFFSEDSRIPSTSNLLSSNDSFHLLEGQTIPADVFLRYFRGLSSGERTRRHVHDNSFKRLDRIVDNAKSLNTVDYDEVPTGIMPVYMHIMALVSW